MLRLLMFVFLMDALSGALLQVQAVNILKREDYQVLNKDGDRRVRRKRESTFQSKYKQLLLIFI